jgi:DNA-binding CsgD family transcriptional regulator
MDDKQFSIIVSKIDAIIKLQAIALTQGKTLKEQVSLLSSINFQPKQIADILGKTPNHISVILSDLRKAEKKLLEQSEEQNKLANSEKKDVIK